MKTLTGVVTSTKMQKTAVVRVDRHWRHPLYQKIVKRSKTYLVHDEVGMNEGDTVTIVETRPMSALKRWRVVGKGTSGTLTHGRRNKDKSQ